MSVKLANSELNLVKEFIKAFTKKVCDEVLTEADRLPVKPASFYCTKEEIKAECVYIVLEYLTGKGAPEMLCTTLAYHVAERILASDLGTLEVEIEKPEFQENNEDEIKSSETRIEYDCGKLAIETINTVHCVCKEWAAGSMPTLLKSKYNYEVYYHCDQNTRRKMEDKHVAITQVNNLFGLDKDFPCQAYFAVFDGHGGVEAAMYAAAHLHHNMVKQETYISDTDEALCKAFKVTDEKFLVKANNESLRSGTTGVVVFFRGNTLHVAWLGDSQASMCKQGMAVKLMEPHKPNRDDERQRIEDLGGCVVWFGDWRVNGNISVSRSIGDKDYKPYVSADPDSAEFDLEGDEEYMIIACDGLWDTIAPPDVITIVQDHLVNGGSRATIPKLLVHAAKEQGSSDNITVVIVYLDCHKMALNSQHKAQENGTNLEDVIANGVGVANNTSQVNADLLTNNATT